MVKALGKALGDFCLSPTLPQIVDNFGQVI